MDLNITVPIILINVDGLNITYISSNKLVESKKTGFVNLNQ